MQNIEPSTEDYKQLNVRLPKWMHDDLTMESARRTVAEGHEITRQEIVIDTLMQYRKPLYATVLGRSVRLDWDEATDRYVGRRVWSSDAGWACTVPLTEESFASATIEKEVDND